MRAAMKRASDEHETAASGYTEEVTETFKNEEEVLQAPRDRKKKIQMRTNTESEILLQRDTYWKSRKHLICKGNRTFTLARGIPLAAHPYQVSANGEVYLVQSVGRMSSRMQICQSCTMSNAKCKLLKAKRKQPIAKCKVQN